MHTQLETQLYYDIVMQLEIFKENIVSHVFKAQALVYVVFFS